MENCIDLCTNGTDSMAGRHLGFVTKTKEFTANYINIKKSTEKLRHH